MYTTLIDTDTVAAHLDDPEWLVVDCRFSLTDTEQGRRDYQAAHIPGALYAHLDEHLSGPVVRGKTGRHPLPDIAAMARTFSGWGIDGRVQVAAYDDNVGSVAARLWWLLRWLGHDAVAVLDGGWARWREESRPVSAAAPVRPPRTFTPRVRSHLVVDAGQVEAARNDAAYRLLDARTPERYRGEVEPIDPVAGHIPGAVCASFTENTENGRMRSPDALRARFQNLTGDTEIENTICYCGSGVTACHNLLAIAHAGLGDARLYAGSWSDWITDPGRPVATAE